MKNTGKILLTAGAMFLALGISIHRVSADTPSIPSQAQLGANQGAYPVNVFKGWDVSCYASTNVLNTATDGGLQGARSVTIMNTSSSTVRIGGSEVSGSVGFALPAGASMSIAIDRESSTAPVLKCASPDGGAQTLSILGAK